MSDLLYISPVVPAATGNGLAMRAGMVLRVLAERHRVRLLVVPRFPSPDAELPPELAGRCREVVILPRVPAAAPEPTRLPRSLRAWLGLDRPPAARPEPAETPLLDVAFDAVHVFRLSMLPYARPYLAPPAGRRPARHLDLDDVESITLGRLAELYRRNREAALARHHAAEATSHRRLEDEVLRDFDRLYVCSEADRRLLLARRPRARLCVLPNALPVPAPLPRPPEAGPFTFLFVGTLGYYPNEDGLRFFCREVLPRLQRIAPRDVRLDIVGIGMSAGVQALGELPGVRLVGYVPDVAPRYAWADAVVVPIRAGGGTRIKVLEAFAHRRPVVSTTVGAEGIDARDGEHLLLGDTPEDFAERCARLMTEPALGAGLAERAFALFSARYTIEAAARAVAACDDSPPRPGSPRAAGWPAAR